MLVVQNNMLNFYLILNKTYLHANLKSKLFAVTYTYLQVHFKIIVFSKTCVKLFSLHCTERSF